MVEAEVPSVEEVVRLEEGADLRVEVASPMVEGEASYQ